MLVLSIQWNIVCQHSMIIKSLSYDVCYQVSRQFTLQ